MFEFALVPGPAAQQILDDDAARVVEIVRQTYLDHHAGDSVNPDSYFLRFPDRPEARIIALPAYLGGSVQRAGIKWIASFPRNIEQGFPRASAVLVLNDAATGYPVALLEGAGISAARTAGCAALAARALRPDAVAGTGTTAVIGAGLIARTTCDYLLHTGSRPDRFLVHDLHEPSAQALIGHLRAAGVQAEAAGGLDKALRADTVLLTTTAGAPYVTEPFAPGQLVLNVSLRDLAPEVILAADNFLDDVEHCLKANTSPHLAEQATGSRDFVTGTLAQVLSGELAADPERATIFSPFGLGVLDLAVGAYVLDQALAQGTAHRVPDFFGTTRRW